ncbi:MFS transporter [uncultured Propionivibrio sp.]|uniref:MFS transporter n=1 Tax=uncultured Propionivibrio sp. TaxID=426737 RepID=UPI0029C0C515|nr:MFS transporter [uncultured Propionivibrio sp.]
MKPDWLLIRLILVQVFIHACMTGMRMAAPLLALRQGHSAAAVGVLMSLFALTLVFLSLPAGRFADRNTLRRPVGIAILCAASGTSLAVIWPVFPVLCVSALLAGGSAGSALIALQRHVGRMATNQTERRQVFSWLAIGPSISNFIGPFAAGIVIDTAGFRAAFALMAAFPLISWWLVRGAPEQAQPEQPDDDGQRRSWDLLAEPKLRRLLLINWILASCWDVHTFVVPLIGHERGLSASVIGLILGAFAVAATAIRGVLPLVAERVEEWAVIFGAMLVTATLLFVYPTLLSALTMGTCSVLLGFSLGVVQPMVMSTLHQITPEHRHGEALGLRMMSINASSVLMPLLFGSAGAVVGVKAVFWAVGSTVGMGARLAWGMRPRVLPK